MKKTFFAFALAAGMVAFASCESTREERTDEHVEEVGADVEEAAEEVEDETEEAAENVERNNN